MRAHMQFDASSTAEEVVGGIDLGGKTIVVTGSSAGLGRETARVLAKAGASIVMAARDLEKNQRACAAIRAEFPRARLQTVSFDLADLGSVRRAADQILSAHGKIDVLINNAGFVGGPLSYTAEGCELHFGANHIGPFLFTNLLMQAVKAAAPARVVVLSSNGHRMSGVDFDDLRYEKRPYNHWSAYSQSKRANVLFAVGLTRRVAKYGITANAVHPGVIRTEVFRDVTADEEKMVTDYGESHGSPVKSIPQGAATQVWAAVAPELAQVSGRYLEDCRVAELDPDPSSGRGAMPDAFDPDIAERLWTVSEEIVGQRFSYD